MAKFQPRLETCPTCGSKGNCHIHDYYGRSIIDFRSGAQKKSNLCVLRVFCDSCNHAHAILPNVIIPYSSYSLFFALRILGEYFAGLYTIEQLCERYGISQKRTVPSDCFCSGYLHLLTTRPWDGGQWFLRL